MGIKHNKVNIKEQRNESPFILDLKSLQSPPLLKGEREGIRPRRLVFCYYKLKYYFLLLFRGERRDIFYNIHQQRPSFLLNNLILPSYHFLKIPVNALFFILKSFKNVFVVDKNEIKAANLEPPMLYQPPLTFAYASFKKHLGAFLIILLLISSPFTLVSLYNSLKMKAVAAKESGKDAIKILASEFGTNNFDQGLKLASTNFQTAYRDLQDINFFLRGLLDIMPGQKGDEYRMAKKIFQAAHEITLIVPAWKNAISSLQDKKDNLARIEILEETIKLTEPKVFTVFYNLNSIDSEKLPKEIQGIFESARDYFHKTMSSLEEIKESCALLKEALGVYEPKRYLLIFQNNNELRPTGGFMGSFAEIIVSGGKVVKTFFPGGGTYDLEGALRRFVVSPKPLQLISERWEFQDANWFPDFPTSARKIMWFYENSGGPTVDGVIAINVNFVVDLLKLLGPIKMQEWNKTLTADNFVDEIQQAVALEFDSYENQPKKILAEFYPLFLEKLEDAWGDNFIELIKIYGNAVKKKDIQFYFSNKDLQEKILVYGAGGEIKSFNDDYLYIVNTNIAGGKTDGKIFETIDILTEISESGIITNTLSVTRKHSGIKRQGFAGVRNVDYVRIYVPKGSRLLSAKGFIKPPEELFKTPLPNLDIDKDLSRVEKVVGYDKESGTTITEEFNKIVFGNWIMVDPGEEVTYTLVYQLPMIVDTTSQNFWSYSFFLQKQPGSNPAKFVHTIKAPEKFRQFWHYPEVGDDAGVLDKDFFSAIIFIK